MPWPTSSRWSSARSSIDKDALRVAEESKRDILRRIRATSVARPIEAADPDDADA